MNVTYVNAQSKLDSLQKLLTTVEGIEKINAHNQLSEILWQANQLDRAKKEAEQALILAEKLGHTSGAIAAIENIGMASKGDYTQKIYQLQLALAMAEKANELETIVRISINIAQTFLQPNNYQKSLEYYLNALTINKRLGNKKLEARALSGIAWVYKSSKKYHQALESYQRSIALNKELGDDRTIGWTFIACASVYVELKEYTHAIEHCQEAFTYFKSQTDSSGMALALHRIGEVFTKQSMWENAIPFLTQSLQMSERHQYASFMALSNKSLGEVYRGKKQNEKALVYYLRALSLAERLQMREMISEISKSIADLYKANGDYKNALAYHERFFANYDSVFNQEKNKQIAELQARFENENKENEILTLRKEQEISRIYQVGGTSVFILLLITSILAINHQRLKVKKNQAIALQEKQLLENEVERQRLAEEKLRVTIEHNNKSLTAYTLNLIHKNEVLDDIKAKVQQIRILPEPELRASLNNLLRAVNYSIHLDKDWDNFKQHFEQVHQGFFDKLKEHYPDLSPYDLRLCSLIKLNLETKQIATLLDISTESAKVARSRVRKKMGLQTEQNLQEFLQTF